MLSAALLGTPQRHEGEIQISKTGGIPCFNMFMNPDAQCSAPGHSQGRPRGKPDFENRRHSVLQHADDHRCSLLHSWAFSRETKKQQILKTGGIPCFKMLVTPDARCCAPGHSPETRKRLNFEKRPAPRAATCARPQMLAVRSWVLNVWFSATGRQKTS